ncbi:MAG: hypothetical protein EHM37_04625 [Deltaproteobacteria bacterium]|nr:MAG: hypothetical protein EHM37_04625 [Deltaproteobacteria bacterium]
MGRFRSIADVMIVFFHYSDLLIKKKFALLNPNIYKTANGAAVAGAAIGECPQRPDIGTPQAL